MEYVNVLCKPEDVISMWGTAQSVDNLKAEFKVMLKRKMWGMLGNSTVGASYSNIPVSSYIFMGEEKDHRKSKCLNHTANSGRVRISAWVCPASGSMSVSAALHSADSIVRAEPEASSQPGLWWWAFSMERQLWVRITGNLVSVPGCWQDVMGQGCQPWSSLLNFFIKISNTE